MVFKDTAHKETLQYSVTSQNTTDNQGTSSECNIERKLQVLDLTLDKSGLCHEEQRGPVEHLEDGERDIESCLEQGHLAFVGGLSELAGCPLLQTT